MTNVKQILAQACWTERISETSKKLPKKDFSSKMKDFDTFTKIA